MELLYRRLPPLASLLLAAHEQVFLPPFPQQVIITSCQTADVIWCLAVGGSCLWGVDEVIHPPSLSKPLQRRPCSLLSFSFKRAPLTSETAAIRAATANVQAPLLISGPVMTVRNKCRTLNYPADGVGIEGTLKPHESFEHFTISFLFFHLHSFIYSTRSSSRW